MVNLTLSQTEIDALADLANRAVTLYNDVRQVLDHNSGLQFSWPVAITVTVGATDVTNNTLAATAHGLANGQKGRVVLPSGANGVTMPAPLAVNTDYFVVGTAANTFQLALTRGGAAIDITVQSVGTVQYQPIPDYLTLDADGNVTGKTNTPTEVSNAIGSLTQFKNLMANAGVTQGDHVGNLNKLARPAG